MEMEEHEGSSDDEQYSLPKEWKEHSSVNHVVEDVRHQEWEYRGNEVVQGATYPTIEAVKDAENVGNIIEARIESREVWQQRI